jgi:hypothetical protein
VCSHSLEVPSYGWRRSPKVHIYASQISRGCSAGFPQGTREKVLLSLHSVYLAEIFTNEREYSFKIGQ